MHSVDRAEFLSRASSGSQGFEVYRATLRACGGTRMAYHHVDSIGRVYASGVGRIHLRQRHGRCRACAVVLTRTSQATPRAGLVDATKGLKRQ